MAAAAPVPVDDFPSLIGHLYATWTLDCLIEIGGAVSVDLITRPQLYLSEDIPDTIVDLRMSYGNGCPLPKHNSTASNDDASVRQVRWAKARCQHQYSPILHLPQEARRCLYRLLRASGRHRNCDVGGTRSVSYRSAARPFRGVSGKIASTDRPANERNLEYGSKHPTIAGRCKSVQRQPAGKWMAILTPTIPTAPSWWKTLVLCCRCRRSARLDIPSSFCCSASLGKVCRPSYWFSPQIPTPIRSYFP